MKNSFIICIGLIIFSVNAHAYLDAGTGSIMIQLLFGGIAVAGSLIKMYWYKIKSFFSSKKDDSSLPDDSNVQE